jgi:N-acetylneuraminic acid mutarotase
MNSKSETNIHINNGSTLQLFSKFFELVTNEEKDSEYLKYNLHNFLQTFNQYDKNFSLPQEFLGKLLYNPNPSGE